MASMMRVSSNSCAGRLQKQPFLAIPSKPCISRPLVAGPALRFRTISSSAIAPSHVDIMVLESSKMLSDAGLMPLMEVGEGLETPIQLIYLLSLLGLLSAGAFLVVRQVLVRRELDEAAKGLGERVRTGEASCEDYFELGVVLTRKRLYTQATKNLEKAKKVWDGEESELAQVHNALGFCYFNMDKVADAIVEYRKAVELQPGYVTAWNNLGDALEKDKMWKDALQAYQEALSYAPSNQVAMQRSDFVKTRIESFTLNSRVRTRAFNGPARTCAPTVSPSLARPNRFHAQTKLLMKPLQAATDVGEKKAGFYNMMLRHAETFPLVTLLNALLSSKAKMDMNGKVVKVQEQVSQEPSLSGCKVNPTRVQTDVIERLGFMANADVQPGGVIISIPEKLAITSADADDHEVIISIPEKLAITSADAEDHEVIISIPEKLAITSADAEDHEVVGELAAGCSELISLTLWLMAERAKGAASASSALISTLPEATLTPLLWTNAELDALLQSSPETTLTPLLWTDAELDALLQGSPVPAEARSRVAELKKQWAELEEQFFSQDKTKFNPDIFNYDSFARAFAVIMAHAIYLPSASCFALLPVASLMARTGNENGCNLDYDTETQSVVITSPRTYRAGQEVMLNDGRPNDEMLLATGTIQEVMLNDGRPNDDMLLAAGTIQNDNAANSDSFGASLNGSAANSDTLGARLAGAERYSMTKPIKTEQNKTRSSFAFGLSDGNAANFVNWNASLVEGDKYFMMKSQILESFGLSSNQNFPVYADRMPNQLFAYLRLVRVADPALFAKISFEQDVVLSQMNEYEDPDLSPKERLAVKQRLTEKRLVSATMDAVRRRLAPIRGVPTKAGFENANSDIEEIFATLEAIPNAPANLMKGIMSWAKGDQDPDWGKPNKPDKKLPPKPW
eukprot:gene20004-26717_t